MKSICIVGSGTAGSMAALMYRAAFPATEITVISSSDIGIIGVGEGSTEQWRMFMRACDLPTAEILVETAGTHKTGIRFEGWTNHTPDYFHSVSNVDPMNPFGVYALYCGIHKNNKLLTNSIAVRGIVEGKVVVNNPHETVNQFHFDTFKLNEYLRAKCIQRNVKLVEGIVDRVILDPETGFVNEVLLQNGAGYKADFFIDATGFRRVLMTAAGNTEWVSFSKHLPMDSALAFPSPLPEDRVVNTYTRAIAKSSGWMWEIPTQERRGNGYVYCSQFITDEEARQEASRQVGFEVEPARTFKFDAGCVKKFWHKNILAVGLSGAFVEPLEATSIGSTYSLIQASVRYLATFNGDPQFEKTFNKRAEKMMENLEAMIALHYISDRNDTEFWRYAQTLERPPYLQELLDNWQVMLPGESEIPNHGLEMFLAAHFWHVAQGQGVLPKHLAEQTISVMQLDQIVQNRIWELRKEQNSVPLQDHLKSLLVLKEQL